MSTLTWPKFKKQFATDNPGSAKGEDSKAWAKYKEEHGIVPKTSAKRASPGRGRKTSAGRGKGKAHASKSPPRVYGERSTKKVSAKKSPAKKTSAKRTTYKGTPVSVLLKTPAPVRDIRGQTPIEVTVGKLTIKLPASIWKDVWIPIVRPLPSAQDEVPAMEKIYGHAPLFTKADGHWPDTADLYKEANHKNATPLAFVAQFFDPRPDGARGKGASKGTRFVQVFSTNLEENQQEYTSLVRELDISQPEKVIPEPPGVPNATHGWNDPATGEKAERKGYEIIGWDLKSETTRDHLYKLVDAIKKPNIDKGELVEGMMNALMDVGWFQEGRNTNDHKKGNVVKVGGYLMGDQGETNYEAFLQNVYYHGASGSRVSVVIKDDGETLQAW